MSKIVGELNAEIMKKVIHDRRAKLFAEIVAKTGSKQSVIDRAIQEIESLREQVEKLKAELTSIDGALNDPRANLTLTTSEIIWELKEQVEKLTKERDALKTVPMKYRRMQFNAELQDEVTQLQKQLLALAEQNEKLRAVLDKLARLGNEPYLGNSIGNRIAAEALSLTNLATPVLNETKGNK